MSGAERYTHDVRTRDAAALKPFRDSRGDKQSKKKVTMIAASAIRKNLDRRKGCVRTAMHGAVRHGNTRADSVTRASYDRGSTSGLEII